VKKKGSNMNKKKIYLFRHGSTDWNLEGRFQGHRNVPLNADGIAQAQALQNYFLHKTISSIYASDLSRAQDTAAHALGVSLDQIRSVVGLREIHLGAAEGLTKEQIVEKYGDSVWHRWVIGDPHFSFENGETKVQAAQRVGNCIRKVVEATNHESIAICSHGFVLRLFLTDIGYKIERIANCQVFEINYSQKTFSTSATYSPSR